MSDSHGIPSEGRPSASKRRFESVLLDTATPPHQICLDPPMNATVYELLIIFNANNEHIKAKQN